MIRQIVRGATFQRDAYLRAVLSSNGTGDAVIIVAVVYLVLALTISVYAVSDVLGIARFVLSGGFAWLILTGLIYLIARYAIHGQGSYQGMLAMSALAHPVLLLLVLLPVGGAFSFFARPTLAIMHVDRFEFLGTVAVILATLWFLAILVAGTRVAMGIAIDRAILAVAGGYLGWWVLGTMLGV